MSPDRPHILIGVSTTERLDGLDRLLEVLATATSPADGVDVAVVDNAPSDDTHRVVERAAARTGRQIAYLAESEPGIPFARNACVRAALERGANALIFIDDDEWPASGWLEALLATWRRTEADIVVGPAKAVLPADAPGWARHSGVFDKDRNLPDGAAVRTAYSYNTLVSRHALETLGPTFDAAFRYTGASDHHYFKQAAAAGLRSVWSADALVYEEVDPGRVRLAWVVKRGYRIGAGVRRSTRLRIGGLRGVLRITLLAVANLGFAGWQIVRTVRRRGSWVEGLRRLAIALGLLGGSLSNYQEYSPIRRSF